MLDPDVPDLVGMDNPFIHWLAYNISPENDGLKEGERSIEQGLNSFGKRGYGGPMPPKGHGVHHYTFTLFALDADLQLERGMTFEELMEAIEGHVISKAKMTATYERKEARRIDTSFRDTLA